MVNIQWSIINHIFHGLKFRFPARPDPITMISMIPPAMKNNVPSAPVIIGSNHNEKKESIFSRLGFSGP